MWYSITRWNENLPRWFATASGSMFDFPMMNRTSLSSERSNKRKRAIGSAMIPEETWARMRRSPKIKIPPRTCPIQAYFSELPSVPRSHVLVRNTVNWWSDTFQHATGTYRSKYKHWSTTSFLLLYCNTTLKAKCDILHRSASCSFPRTTYTQFPTLEILSR